MLAAMPYALMVEIGKKPRSRRNLELGLSAGRWAFPTSIDFDDAEHVEIGDLIFFGVGGNPRGGDKLAGWHRRRLAEAHLARVVSLPYENGEPFWYDERSTGEINWNPTIEIEYLADLGPLALAPGRHLSAAATESLYKAAVSHKVRRVSTAGSPILRGWARKGLQRTPAPPGVPQPRFVAFEAKRLRKAKVKGRPPGEADPRESRLGHDYRDHLVAGGDVVQQILIPLPSGTWIRSDHVNLTRRTLVEAKSTMQRSHIREAIGQIFDYGRFCDYKRALLLPERPDADILNLLTSLEIAAVWPEGKGFADSAEGAFT
jgi:hypothetical protein